MQQLKVSLPDDMRARLDAASTAAGRTLGEEIRRGLEEAFFWGQFDPFTRLLMAQIGFAAQLTKAQTGRDWQEHAGAHRVFQQTISSLLARRKPAGEEAIAASELPQNRPVGSADLTEMGIALEAMISFGRPLSDQEQHDLHERLHKDDAHWRALLQPLMDGTRPPPPPRSHMRKPKGE
jgi:hypothetical protein